MDEKPSPSSPPTPTLYDQMKRSCSTVEHVYVFCFAFLDMGLQQFLQGLVTEQELRRNRFQLEAARVARLHDLEEQRKAIIMETRRRSLKIGGKG